MNLIVDASVAIKWFVTENLHQEARRLLEGRDSLHAPDLLIVELANMAWKKAVRREIDSRQARHIARACRDDIPVLWPSVDLVDRALEISLRLEHPVYDCVYIACAEAAQGVLVTADERLCAAAKRTKFDALVKHLSRMAVASGPP